MTTIKHIPTQIKLRTEKQAGQIYVTAGIVSFPKLHKAESFQGSAPRYGSNIMIDKTAENLKTLKEAAISALMAKKYNTREKAEQAYAQFKAKGIVSFRDGDLSERPEEHGKIIIAAYASEDRKPRLINPMKQDVPDDKVLTTFYPGCYADFIVNLYVPETYGGIRASLSAVMFRADGVRLSASAPVSDDDFEDIETTEMDDFGSENAEGLL